MKTDHKSMGNLRESEKSILSADSVRNGVLQLFVNFTAISLSKFYVAEVIELPFPRLRQSRDY